MDRKAVLRELEKWKPAGFGILFDGVLQNAEGVAFVVEVSKQEAIRKLLRPWIRLGLDFEVYPLSTIKDYIDAVKEELEEEGEEI